MSNEDTIRIVVGVDFEDQGDHALDEAIRYAAQIDNDELHPVFCVAQWDRTDVGQVDSFLDRSVAALRARVSARCELVNHEWEQDIVFHVRFGDPAEGIHQVAVDVDAHLIVVGTHSRTGVSKMILGSVAEKLTREARFPVMVARPRDLDGVDKTAAPEAAREGEDLHGQRIMSSERLSFKGRPGHIAGLV